MGTPYLWSIFNGCRVTSSTKQHHIRKIHDAIIGIGTPLSTLDSLLASKYCIYNSCKSIVIVNPICLQCHSEPPSQIIQFNNFVCWKLGSIFGPFLGILVLKHYLRWKNPCQDYHPICLVESFFMIQIAPQSKSICKSYIHVILMIDFSRSMKKEWSDSK